MILQEDRMSTIADGHLLLVLSEAHGAAEAPSEESSSLLVLYTIDTNFEILIRKT
jgi:hypothetical protein